MTLTPRVIRLIHEKWDHQRYIKALVNVQKRKNTLDYSIRNEPFDAELISILIEWISTLTERISYYETHYKKEREANHARRPDINEI